MQAKLEEAETENVRLRETVDSLQKRKAEADALLHKYMDELKECRDELLDTQSHFKQELETKEKLAHLYEVTIDQWL